MNQSANKDVQRALVPTVIAIVLAGVLLLSAFAHLLNPYFFMDSIFGYRITSTELTLATAVVLPFIQIGIGMTLLNSANLREGLILSLLLMLFFVILQSSAWIRGINTSCGCFGGSGSSIGWKSMLFSGGCSLLSALGLYLLPKREPT
jgi:putative oxidoreductase